MSRCSPRRGDTRERTETLLKRCGNSTRSRMHRAGLSPSLGLSHHRQETPTTWHSNRTVRRSSFRAVPRAVAEPVPPPVGEVEESFCGSAESIFTTPPSCTDASDRFKTIHSGESFLTPLRAPSESTSCPENYQEKALRRPSPCGRRSLRRCSRPFSKWGLDSYRKDLV